MTSVPLSSLSVFFPCHNEAENIPELLTTALAYLPTVARKYEIIVVNDGSTDGTAQVVKVWAEQHPEVRLASHTKNRGYGAALKTGIKQSKYEWILWTDGDLQFDIQTLDGYLPFVKEYKAILGYRAHRADTFLRKVNGELYTQMINILFRLGVKDIDCGFKLIKSSELKSLPLTTSSAFTSAEILIRLKKRGITFKQIPVPHFPRRHGTPTGGSPKVIFKGLRQAAQFFLQRSY